MVVALLRLGGDVVEAMEVLRAGEEDDVASHVERKMMVATVSTREGRSCWIMWMEWSGAGEFGLSTHSSKPGTKIRTWSLGDAPGQGERKGMRMERRGPWSRQKTKEAAADWGHFGEQ